MIKILSKKRYNRLINRINFLEWMSENQIKLLGDVINLFFDMLENKEQEMIINFKEQYGKI